MENIWDLEGQGNRGVKKLHNEELSDLYFSHNVVRVIQSRRVRWGRGGYSTNGGRRCIQSYGGET